MSTDKTSWDDCRAAYERIFARDYYTNHGPLERELDHRIADFLGVRHGVSVANGATAMMLALHALDLTGPVALPLTASPRVPDGLQWARLQAIDLPGLNHCTPRDLSAAVERGACALLLAPEAGSLAKVEALALRARAAGLRLVADGTDAWTHASATRRLAACCDVQVIGFPSHPFMTRADGACIATNDDGLAARLRGTRSFHDGPHTGPWLRFNAKMSEAQAATVLLGLDRMART